MTLILSQKIVVIRTRYQLEMFLLVGQEREVVANCVRSLSVVFQSTPPSFIKLRLLLLLVPQLSHLVLEFACNTPTLLHGVKFPYLQHFHATSINHGALSNFLQANPRISNISIGRCGRARVCPIRCKPYLPSATLFSGASCLLSVPINYTYKSIVDLQSRIHNTRDAFVSPRKVLSNRKHCLKRLRHLRLDINFSMATDHGFMQDIIELAPSIRTLELVECELLALVCTPTSHTLHIVTQLILHQDSRGPRHRRAWNHHSTWARCLTALPNLEVFKLKTSAPLVPHPGDYHEEQQLVEGWISTQEPNPSCLQSVLLWYLADTSYASHNDFTDFAKYPILKGVFSWWSKVTPDQAWQRVEFITGAL